MAVSPWGDSPFTFLIDVNQAGFDSAVPEDGIFHLSAEIEPKGGVPLLQTLFK
jgi:hypothetical protein